ncbi:MAG: hypothetical protein R2852_05730 [Bacteroidia bacterium]
MLKLFFTKSAKDNFPHLFYQESNKVNIPRLLISYFIVLCATLILGYLYAVITTIMPIIQINFMILLAFGVALGLINRLLMRVSYNRSKKSRLILAFVTALFASYFQWTTYILYQYNGDIPSYIDFLSNLSWIIQPKNFFSAIIKINEIGPWSVFGFRFAGTALTVLWVLEFLIIVALSMFAVLVTQVYPYSELMQKWYPKYTLANEFENISVLLMLDELQKDPLQAIQNLNKGLAFRYSKIHVFYEEHEEYQYLTFEKVYISDGGRGSKKSEIVLNNFKISKDVADTLLKTYRNNRERIDVI